MITNLYKTQPTAVNYLTEPIIQVVKKPKTYEEKLKERNQRRFDITPENADFVWNHLSQALFSIDYASFHVKALQRKGAFPDSDELMKFANQTEKKFENFLSQLNDDGKTRYRKERSEFEEFVRQFATFSDEDRKRLYGMSNKIERDKFKK